MVVAALLAGVVFYGLRMLREMPGAAIDKSTALVGAIGGAAAKVARAFNEKTVREDDLFKKKVEAATELVVITDLDGAAGVDCAPRWLQSPGDQVE